MTIPFSFESLDLHTVKYEQLGGSSYIPLPKYLAAKKALVNIKNEDDECFKWAIIRALNQVEKTLNVFIKTSRKMRGLQLGWSEISSQFE